MLGSLLNLREVILDILCTSATNSLRKELFLYYYYYYFIIVVVVAAAAAVVVVVVIRKW